jgi:chromosome segregation ATPase
MGLSYPQLMRAYLIEQQKNQQLEEELHGLRHEVRELKYKLENGESMYKTLNNRYDMLCWEHQMRQIQCKEIKDRCVQAEKDYDELHDRYSELKELQDF